MGSLGSASIFWRKRRRPIRDVRPRHGRGLRSSRRTSGEDGGFRAPRPAAVLNSVCDAARARHLDGRPSHPEKKRARPRPMTGVPSFTTGRSKSALSLDPVPCLCRSSQRRVPSQSERRDQGLRYNFELGPATSGESDASSEPGNEAATPRTSGRSAKSPTAVHPEALATW